MQWTTEHMTLKVVDVPTHDERSLSILVCRSDGFSRDTPFQETLVITLGTTSHNDTVCATIHAPNTREL